MIKSIKYKNDDLSYYDDGKGKVVVLLHGFLENHSFWEPLTKKLKKKFRVIAPDIPGHGETASLGYLHSMELLADSVFEILKKNKLRKVDLVGHSMGGYVALAFIEKYPDYVRSITLLNSTARDDSAWKKKDRDRAIALIKKNPNLFISTAIPSLYVDSPTKKIQQAIEKSMIMAKECSVKGIVACLEGMKLRSNREIVLRFAPCPVLIIAGRKDKTIPIEQIEEQISMLEMPSVYLSEKGGHMCLYEDTNPTIQAIEDFLSHKR